PRPRASLTYWMRQARDDPWTPQAIRDLLALEPKQRSAEQERRLREHYFRQVHDATRERLAPLEQELEETRAKLAETEESIPTTLISEEAPTPRPAHILLRGDYRRKGERVEKGVPPIFPALPPDAPRN